MKTPILSNEAVHQTSGRFAAVCFGAFMLAAIPSALAQNLWQNPDLINGGDWHAATNWSAGSIPTSSTVTHINNGGLAIINANAATRELTIGDTAAGNRLEILVGTLNTRGVAIGLSTGSSGSVRLAAGAEWDTDGAGSYSALTVGTDGSGTLLIESGATLHSGRSRIAVNAGSTGEATVRGTWIWEHNQTVGLGAGAGVLNLGSGGKVSLTGATQVVSLGANSMLNIGGKTTAEAAGRLNAGSVNGGGTLNFNHTDVDYIFETETNTPIVIAGAAKVNQVSGTTTLTASNTYTGATSITGGALLVNGSLATNSAVTVSVAGTLGGIGSVGNVTVNGTLAPGSHGVGTLSTRDVSLASTATLSIELGVQAGNPVSDMVRVTGTFSLASGSNLQLSLGSGLDTPSLGNMFFLVDNGGVDAISGVFSKLNGVDTVLNEGSSFFWDSQQYQITYLADFGTSSFTGGNDLALMVVPEPSSLLLFSLSITALCFRRRR